jgi:hypothetical protein
MANGLFEVAKNLLDPAAMMRGGGELAILGGRPVVWAGPQMGWQSPESFFEYTGPQQAEALTGAKSPAEIYQRATSLRGYKPEAMAAKTPKTPKQPGTVTPGGMEDQLPPPPPILPPPPNNSLPQTTAPYSGTTVPQQQDETVRGLFEYLKELGDPSRLKEVEGMRLENLLKSQLLTSELTRQGERARYARDIEKANIDSWKERQIAMYNANAIANASLGAATIAAFAPPNASALSSTLSAAMQPFSNIGVKRG